MSETKREVYEALLEATGYGVDSLNDEVRAEWMKRYDAADDSAPAWTRVPIVDGATVSPLARDRGWPGDDVNSEGT